MGLLLLFRGVGEEVGLRFNLSSSMPIGFYVREQGNQLMRFEDVAVCLSNPIAAMGIERGYLRSGSCANHSEPVIKEIIGLPGDTVIVTKKETIINHRRYYTPVQLWDHKSHSVKRLITNGHYHLVNTFWLYGFNNAKDSWDSRYYGAISTRDIHGIYKPVWILGTHSRNSL